MRRNKFRFPVTSLAGSTPQNIINLLRRHKTEPKYYLKIILSFLASLIFTPFNLAEKLILRKRIINFHFEEPPLFIIGFMRSGTTLLHNLLCQDPKAGYTTTFQTVFPHSVLTQGWWLKPLTNCFLPANRPFDNVSMDMDFPQEEEFAMANLQLFSVYNLFLFPSEFDSFIDHDYFTTLLPARDLERWKKEYRRMVIKSLLNTNGERYVSKNPHNIPRLEILKEMFPGCNFIFIYRDPYVVVESLYNFILSIFPGVQLQDIPAGFSRKDVARFYSIAMNYYFKMKEKGGPLPIMEIRMEDFLKDKIGVLRNIYKVFRLERFEMALPSFELWLAENSCAPHETCEIHKETIHYVNEYAREIVVRLGYPLRNDLSKMN
jgi:omega-hydroxy-beta-dihydromenaquinone-9 sulfotransferase